MKRILPVLLALVFILALFAVPAFADGEPVTYEATLNEDINSLTFAVVPPAGTYSLRFYWIDGKFVDSSITLSVSDPPEGAEDLYSYALSGYVADTDYEMFILVDGIINSDYPDLRYNLCSFFLVYGDEQDPVFVTRAILTPISSAPDQPAAPTGDPADVFAIFSAIGDWVLDQIPVILVLFWNAETSQLTVLGGLAILFVGIGLTALFVTLVRRFFKFV